MFILEKRERERERERYRLWGSTSQSWGGPLSIVSVSDTDTELDLGFRKSPYVISEKSPKSGHEVRPSKRPRRGAIFGRFCTSDTLRTIWSRGRYTPTGASFDRFCVTKLYARNRTYWSRDQIFSQLWSRDLSFQTIVNQSFQTIVNHIGHVTNIF